MYDLDMAIKRRAATVWVAGFKDLAERFREDHKEFWGDVRAVVGSG